MRLAAPSRSLCQCAQPVLPGRPAKTFAEAQAYTAPFALQEYRPGWWDIVDGQGAHVNVLPLCIHEATRMLSWVLERESNLHTGVTPMPAPLQEIVRQLQAVLETVEAVAARTDSLVDQEILEDACAELARCLARIQATPAAPRSTR